MASLIRVPGTVRAPETGNPGCTFANAAELLACCEGNDGAQQTIGGIMRRREEALIGIDAARAAMSRVIEVMHAETAEPLERPRRSLGGLIGGEAKRVQGAAGTFDPALMGAVQTEAVARAMAVLERSASMGVIVAAPTAGSAGVVPGCVLATAKALGLDADAIQDALYAAAAVGLILTLNASVAGAEGGCQAEVGSAAAMAACALVQMQGGTPRQALDAASLTLGNLLGLVCDPVGGLVEVPCQNRNAIGVAAAFSSAQLALSGIEALVPLDEMATVMRDVGRALPASLRETARHCPSSLSARGMRLVRRVRGTPLAFGLSAARRDSSRRLRLMPSPPTPGTRRAPRPASAQGPPPRPGPPCPKTRRCGPAPSPATHRESSRRIFHCPHTQV